MHSRGGLRGNTGPSAVFKRGLLDFWRWMKMKLAVFTSFFLRLPTLIVSYCTTMQCNAMYTVYSTAPLVCTMIVHMHYISTGAPSHVPYPPHNTKLLSYKLRPGYAPPAAALCRLQFKTDNQGRKSWRKVWPVVTDKVIIKNNHQLGSYLIKGS